VFRPRSWVARDPASGPAEPDPVPPGSVAARARQLWLSYPARLRAWCAHAFAVGALADYPRDRRYERYIRVPNASLRFEPRPSDGKLGCIISSGPTDRPAARTELAINAEARPLVEWVLETHRAFTLDEGAARFPEFTRPDVADLFGWLAQAG
jgi:hypothetical protein